MPKSETMTIRHQIDVTVDQFADAHQVSRQELLYDPLTPRTAHLYQQLCGLSIITSHGMLVAYLNVNFFRQSDVSYQLAKLVQNT